MANIKNFARPPPPNPTNSSCLGPLPSKYKKCLTSRISRGSRGSQILNAEFLRVLFFALEIVCNSGQILPLKVLGHPRWSNTSAFQIWGLLLEQTFGRHFAEKKFTPPLWKPSFFFPVWGLYGVYPSFQTYGVYPFPLFSQGNDTHHIFSCSATSGPCDRPIEEGWCHGGGVHSFCSGFAAFPNMRQEGVARPHSVTGGVAMFEKCAAKAPVLPRAWKKSAEFNFWIQRLSWGGGSTFLFPPSKPRDFSVFAVLAQCSQFCLEVRWIEV